MTETTALPPNGGTTPTDHPSAPLFVRPRDGRMFAGVCAGIAERWHLDVTLVRIGTVVLTLLSGVGLVAYVAAWLLTPSTDEPAPLAADSPVAMRWSERSRRWGRRGPRLLLIVLAALVVLAFAHWLWLGIPVGLIVVAAVLVLLFGTRLGRWAVAALAAVVALAIATVGIFGTHIGSRTIEVTSLSDLHSTYDYGVGKVSLDLSRLSVAGRHHTDVRLGRGDVIVVVPTGTSVVVHGRSGIGSVTVDGHKVSGIDAEQTEQIGGTPSDADQLIVDVKVGVGAVTFRSA